MAGISRPRGGQMYMYRPRPACDLCLSACSSETWCLPPGDVTQASTRWSCTQRCAAEKLGLALEACNLSEQGFGSSAEQPWVRGANWVPLPGTMLLSGSHVTPRLCSNRGAMQSCKAYRGMELERDGTFEQPAWAPVPTDMICSELSARTTAVRKLHTCKATPGFQAKPRVVVSSRV